MTAYSEQNAAIEAALRRGEKRLDIAQALGVSYARVCKIAKALGIPNSGWRIKPGRALTQAAIAAYAKHGSMERAGAALGVSRQYVDQLIIHHEKATGQRVPRSPPPLQPRIETHCGRCGKPLSPMTEAQIASRSGYCRSCAIFASPHGISDELIEEWVAAVKKGARWHHLALARGMTKNAAHAVPLAVYTRLYRDGRLGEIMQLWPRGVPAYILKRVHARKVPTVWIPHEGKVS